jgi:hypothetical protein
MEENPTFPSFKSEIATVNPVGCDQLNIATDKVARWLPHLVSEQFPEN